MSTIKEFKLLATINQLTPSLTSCPVEGREQTLSGADLTCMERKRGGRREEGKEGSGEGRGRGKGTKEGDERGTREGREGKERREGREGGEGRREGGTGRKTEGEQEGEV